MNFSLGPLQYCWEKSAVESFYDAVAASPIPLVYLGETVCSKRRLLRWQDYLAIAQKLQQAGKSVVLSTLALVQSDAEIKECKKQLENGTFTLEVNDMGMVALAVELKLPFVCGPGINNYNLTSLQKMADWGMQRFVMPVDLSRKWLEPIIASKPSFEIEVFGYGYLPLAHSARCFTARHHQLKKDDCDTICQRYPKGLLSQTMEHQDLLRINGIQTQSAACCDLRKDIPTMANMGIDWFRISPFSVEHIAMATALINGEPHTLLDATNRCNGYWHEAAGMTLV
ncbi:U32 family peptidase [Shewanella avicenniae]|uniref:Ubiquinone biosynthesis protein UbiV n=1 Tax=Shewanella avicenniae TaxID=2814294 RepID=A0ABX7QU05_9GAMM|nr:U32 family peptidase [Shewanella avicenniae]QSX34744.1 U32 family peptidase [Shewanella avicenniae]